MADRSSERLRGKVPPRADGWRLDRFLAEAYPQFSRRKLSAVAKAGKVLLNGRPARPGVFLRAGDTLELPPLGDAVADEGRRVRERSRLREESAAPTEVQVLYEDEDLLIVSKPSGVPVHGGANLGVVRTLLELLSDRVVAGFGLVHRLDRDTSGAIALVRGEALRAETSRLFAEPDAGVEKTYEAIVEGVPVAWEGTIDRPLSAPDRRGNVVVDLESGRQACTRYRVVEDLGEASRVHVELLTGRTHQIRVHLAAMGHPLLVDPRYGHRRGWRLVDPRGRLDARLRRTPLHAARLVLPHPRDGRRIEVAAPLPGDMRYALEVLRVVSGRRRKPDVSGAC